MSDELTQRQFLRAIEDGNCPEILRLVGGGSDVNRPTQDFDGETPLIRAIRTGHLSAVQILIQSGADVNLPQQGKKAWTPLHFAHDHAAIARALIDAGADVNARIPRQATDSSIPGHPPGFAGATALHLAAAANNVEVLRLLIQAGAEVEPLADNGLAPLDVAVKAGSVTEAAEVLAEAGAELTPQRLEAMHSTAHSVDSDLLCFPWAAKLGSNGPTGERSGSPASGMRFGEFKCPQCHTLIYSRKSKLCGTCGGALPADFLLTDAQVRAAQQERKWARDLAESFGSKEGAAGVTGDNERREPVQPAGDSVTFSPQDLLRQTDCAEKFRNRSRPYFGLYVAGYGLLFLTVGFLSQTVGGMPPILWLPLSVLTVVLGYWAWQRAAPICPRCQQNISTCSPIYCLRCGKKLTGQRCDRCAVDHSWVGVLKLSSNQLNFRWIVHCPGCGVWLGSKVRRWGAWGRL